MEATTGKFGALTEATVFLHHFKYLPYPRQRGKIIYPRVKVLLLCLLAVLEESETIIDIGPKRKRMT
jgi:hypothetical protein